MATIDIDQFPEAEATVDLARGAGPHVVAVQGEA